MRIIFGYLQLLDTTSGLKPPLDWRLTVEVIGSKLAVSIKMQGK